MNTPVLETERLLLRPFEKEDAKDVFECWESDPDVAKYMFWTSHNDIEKTKKWIDFEIGQIEKDDWYRFALVLRETKELIGTALIYFEEEVDCWEIGYNLGKKYWGMGYTTEAVKCIIDFAAEQLKIFEIVGRYAKENSASGNVMKKLGFQYEKDIPYECNDGAVMREGIQCRWMVDSENVSKKILITGGTVFVSRYIAEYYVKKGYEVYVLNRNNRPQSEGVILIEADRHNLGKCLKDKRFDVVMDVTAYTGEDVNLLLNALGNFDDYILISSSAVYPETEVQPFTEESTIAENKFWGKYGTNKIDAETVLQKRVPNAYILRPPYLYGPMNNVYREAFVFDCAMENRKFYLPKDGSMKLQFFHVKDLCRFMDVILEKKPDQHIFNVGNEETVDIKEWVSLCYQAAEKEAEFVNVCEDIEQRNYFSFYNYEYYLDVTKQQELMPETESLADGLREAFVWYKENQEKVNKKPYFEFIDKNLIK